MTYQEYIVYLRMIATTAGIDRIGREGWARMQARYAVAIDNIERQLLNAGEVMRKYGPGGVKALEDRLAQLALQSDVVALVAGDIAEITAVGGEFAYEQYNNMVSWDYQVEDFNPVVRTAAEIREAALTVPQGGKTLTEWVQTIFGEANILRAFSDLPADMVDALEGLRMTGTGYRSMVSSLMKSYQEYARKDVITIMRSYTQAVNVKAHTEVYEANQDIVKGVEWMSRLENGNFTTGTGVCPRCAALDGNTYEVGENNESQDAPPCPLHPRCRCLLLPVTKTWAELGLDVDEQEERYRPWVERTEDAIDEGGRRDLLEVGKTDRDYDEWWSTQPKHVQDNVVGVQRSRLINAGYIEFDDIVNNRGDLIPIVELGLTDDELYYARTGKQQ